MRHALLESSARAEPLKVRLACFAIHRRQAYDMLAADAPAKAKLCRQDASGERAPAHVGKLHAPVVRSVEEGLELIDAARAAQMRLPTCAACANWTLEIDTFWCLYLSEPFLIGSMNDGVTVAGRLSSLKFGVGYDGNPEKGFCHAVWGLKFRKAPEYLDGRLLGLLNRQAARVSRGIAGLVDDDASGLVDDDALVPNDDASSHRTTRRRRHAAPRVSTESVYSYAGRLPGARDAYDT